ncbi:hypothetical protein CHARACLAT_014055 [Characodon lateralis]|uniref:Uncharacterized protein n=1 Tax=Characodon lateralis TaxID=208331 RepID=A0ABU7D9M5_9TELE|nr:hypothetical protein [Characodon lateralis]
MELIAGDKSVVEDLSDIDDTIKVAEYQPPQQEPSSCEEDSSGCESPIPHPSQPVKEHKHLHYDYEGYRSDCDIARSPIPRHLSQTQQDEAGVSYNVPEWTTPGSRHQEQSKKEVYR